MIRLFAILLFLIPGVFAQAPSLGNLESLYRAMVGDPARDWLNNFADLLVGTGLFSSMFHLGQVLLVLAIVWSGYQLYVREGSINHLHALVLRFALLAALLFMSNYAYKNPSQPITGGYSCSAVRVNIAHAGFCTWLSSYNWGFRHFIKNPRLDEKMDEALDAVQEALFEIVTLVSISREIKVAAKVLTAARRTRTVVRATEATVDVVKQERKTPWLTWLMRMSGISFVVFAIPFVIYNFFIWLTGASVILIAMLLPVAIGLLAFGYYAPILRMLTTVFSAIVLVAILPLLFFLAVDFAFIRPAHVIQNMNDQLGVAVNAAFDDLATQVTSLDDQLKQLAESAKANDEPSLPWWERLKRAFAEFNPINAVAEWGRKTLGALLRFLGVLIAAVLFSFLMVIAMMITFVVGFNVGMALLWNLAQMLPRLFGAEGPGAQPQGTAMASNVTRRGLSRWM